MRGAPPLTVAQRAYLEAFERSIRHPESTMLAAQRRRLLAELTKGIRPGIPRYREAA